MAMRFILTCLIALISATTASSLTIEEAVRLALDSHQQIDLARADLELARANADSTRSAFLPRLDLGYQYINRDRDPFSSGSEGSTLSIGGSINLFNGWRDQYSHEASQKLVKAESYRLQATIADIVLATQRGYIEVLRAGKSIETAREGVELLERQKRDAQYQFEYGLIARNELLRIDVELSSSRQQLLTAEGQLRIAIARLERLVGKSLEGEEYSEKGFDKKSWEADRDQYRQELLANRSELKYLNQNVAAAESQRQSERGNFWPGVDLALTHERYGDSAIPGDLPGTPDYDNKLLVTANWNLFDGFYTRSRVKAAAARLKTAAAQLRNTEAELFQQLDTALQNAYIATGKLNEAQTGVSQAVENYRVTQNRFQQQQATTVDLLDAQFLLTRARNLEIDARYNLYLASAILERILERKPAQETTQNG